MSETREELATRVAEERGVDPTLLLTTEWAARAYMVLNALAMVPTKPTEDEVQQILSLLNQAPPVVKQFGDEMSVNVMVQWLMG